MTDSWFLTTCQSRASSAPSSLNRTSRRCCRVGGRSSDRNTCAARRSSLGQCRSWLVLMTVPGTATGKTNPQGCEPVYRSMSTDNKRSGSWPHVTPLVWLPSHRTLGYADISQWRSPAAWQSSSPTHLSQSSYATLAKTKSLFARTQPWGLQNPTKGRCWPLSWMTTIQKMVPILHRTTQVVIRGW